MVDLPRILPDGGRSAPVGGRRWSICPGSCLTVVDLPRILPDGGRSADISSACRDGTSTTVWRAVSTVAAVPPQDPDYAGQIDHRRR